MMFRAVLLALTIAVLCACAGGPKATAPMCPPCPTCLPPPEAKVMEKIVEQTVIVEREITVIVPKEVTPAPKETPAPSDEYDVEQA